MRILRNQSHIVLEILHASHGSLKVLVKSTEHIDHATHVSIGTHSHGLHTLFPETLGQLFLDFGILVSLNLGPGTSQNHSIQIEVFLHNRLARSPVLHILFDFLHCLVAYNIQGIKGRLNLLESLLARGHRELLKKTNPLIGAIFYMPVVYTLEVLRNNGQVSHGTIILHIPHIQKAVQASHV